MATGIARLSAKGEKVSKSFEKLRLKAYRSFSDEPWTIGWGTTSGIGVVKVVQGMTCTREQADKWYRMGIAKNEARVNRAVRVPLNQGQFDALVLFDNNTGAIGTASFVKRLNQGNYDAVPAGMRQYVNSGAQKNVKGLVRRREAEIALWNAEFQPKTKRNAAIVTGGATSLAAVGAVAEATDTLPDSTTVDTVINVGSSLMAGYSTVLTVIGAALLIGGAGYMIYRNFKKE